MAAQDAASNAAGQIAGTVGEAGGMAATAMNWRNIWCDDLM